MNSITDITQTGLAVDIDETLSWTVGHWIKLMQEKFGNPENLTANEIAEKYRYVQNIPYWKSEEAYNLIHELVHSDEVQGELPLIENSNLYLNKINRIIPIAAYITVRPESIILSTQKWLEKNNFPKAPIICRPMTVQHQDGSKWKAGVLQKLYPKVVGIIDDNAKLLEFLDENYQGIVFLYDHHTIESKTKVIPCKQWSKVYEEVKKYFSEISRSEKELIKCPHVTDPTKFELLTHEEIEHRKAVYAIIVNNGKILMIKIADSDKHFFPGGGIEEGESMEDALKREMFEETGLEIEIDEFMQTQDVYFYHDISKQGFHNFSHFYFCRLKNEKPPEGLEVDYHEGLPVWLALDNISPEHLCVHADIIIDTVRSHQK